MDKAALYDLVKGYLEGALRVEMESEFGRGYAQGLRTLQRYLATLEGSPVLQDKLPKPKGDESSWEVDRLRAEGAYDHGRDGWL